MTFNYSMFDPDVPILMRLEIGHYWASKVQDTLQNKMHDFGTQWLLLYHADQADGALIEETELDEELQAML